MRLVGVSMRCIFVDMIRSEIYEAIADAMPSGVAHVDLWNANTQFLESEDAWSRPAVFVEFGEILMTATKNRTYRAKGTIALHIVTDFDVYEKDGVFELTDSVATAVDGLHGEGFCIGHITSILTNHNHGDLIEEIVNFDFSAEFDVA